MPRKEKGYYLIKAGGKFLYVTPSELRNIKKAQSKRKKKLRKGF